MAPAWGGDLSTTGHQWLCRCGQLMSLKCHRSDERKQFVLFVRRPAEQRQTKMMALDWDTTLWFVMDSL